MEKKVFIVDKKSGQPIRSFDSRSDADEYFNAILVDRPWASDFVRIFESQK